MRSCQFAPPSFLQKIPLGCVLEGSLGKVVEVVPGIEDPGEGLEVEYVPVRMMKGRGRGSSELGTAVVTIPRPGDPGDGGGGDRGLGPGGEPRSGGGNWLAWHRRCLHSSDAADGLDVDRGKTVQVIETDDVELGVDNIIFSWCQIIQIELLPRAGSRIEINRPSLPTVVEA